MFVNVGATDEGNRLGDQSQVRAARRGSRPARGCLPLRIRLLGRRHPLARPRRQSRRTHRRLALRPGQPGRHHRPDRRLRRRRRPRLRRLRLARRSRSRTTGASSSTPTTEHGTTSGTGFLPGGLGWYRNVLHPAARVRRQADLRRVRRRLHGLVRLLQRHARSATTPTATPASPSTSPTCCTPTAPPRTSSRSRSATDCPAAAGTRAAASTARPGWSSPTRSTWPAGAPTSPHRTSTDGAAPPSGHGPPSSTSPAADEPVDRRLHRQGPRRPDGRPRGLHGHRRRRRPHRRTQETDRPPSRGCGPSTHPAPLHPGDRTARRRQDRRHLPHPLRHPHLPLRPRRRASTSTAPTPRSRASTSTTTWAPSARRSAPTRLLRQMTIMKSMGVNAFRTSHNPPSPEMIEVCERTGHRDDGGGLRLLADRQDTLRLRPLLRRVVRGGRRRDGRARPATRPPSSCGPSATRSPTPPAPPASPWPTGIIDAIKAADDTRPVVIGSDKYRGVARPGLRGRPDARQARRPRPQLQHRHVGGRPARPLPAPVPLRVRVVLRDLDPRRVPGAASTSTPARTTPRAGARPPRYDNNLASWTMSGEYGLQEGPRPEVVRRAVPVVGHRLHRRAHPVRRLPGEGVLLRRGRHGRLPQGHVPPVPEPVDERADGPSAADELDRPRGRRHRRGVGLRQRRHRRTVPQRRRPSARAASTPRRPPTAAPTWRPPRRPATTRPSPPAPTPAATPARTAARASSTSPGRCPTRRAS